MQKTIYCFQCIITILLFLISSCSKDPVSPDPDSSSLNSGRSAIYFNTNADFGNSKTFNIKNTSRTIATSKMFGSAIRYIVLTAEETYGGLDDTRKATLMISVSPSATLPLTIDLITSPSSVPSAQVELYYSYMGGTFGNTYRSSSGGRLEITKLTDTEIEGIFTALVDGSISPGYSITNGTFAGKF